MRDHQQAGVQHALASQLLVVERQQEHGGVHRRADGEQDRRGAATTAFFGLLANTGLTPAPVRDRLLSDQLLGSDQIIYRRGHDRGEIDLDHIPPAVLAMPFDLARHDLRMNLKPLKRARIESTVDELFLPLVQSHQST